MNNHIRNLAFNSHSDLKIYLTELNLAYSMLLVLLRMVEHCLNHLRLLWIKENWKMPLVMALR